MAVDYDAQPICRNCNKQIGCKVANAKVLRCKLYEPARTESDKRTGMQRWPNL